LTVKAADSTMPPCRAQGTNPGSSGFIDGLGRARLQPCRSGPQLMRALAPEGNSGTDGTFPSFLARELRERPVCPRVSNCLPASGQFCDTCLLQNTARE